MQGEIVLLLHAAKYVHNFFQIKTSMTSQIYKYFDSDSFRKSLYHLIDMEVIHLSTPTELQ